MMKVVLVAFVGKMYAPIVLQNLLAVLLIYKEVFKET
jgi:hypothetical protein